MDEVTGRDNQIICQALMIAIPIMQTHSLSASNTHDMQRIFEHRSKSCDVEFPDGKVERSIEEQISTSNTHDMESFEHHSKSRVVEFPDGKVEQSIEKQISPSNNSENRENLVFILFALEQFIAAEDFGFTENECRRNLYTALHQYWQNKEMGLHSTSQRKKIPRTSAAKVSKGKTQVEHVVPLNVIVKSLRDIKRPDKQSVRNKLSDLYRVCIVTIEEHKRLSDAGLRSKMPDDWDGKDPFARYKVVGIEIDYDEF